MPVIFQSGSGAPPQNLLDESGGALLDDVGGVLLSEGSAGYVVPNGDQPLTHARIAHSLNWLSGGTVTASTTDAGYFAEAASNSLSYEKWKPTAPGTWEYDHGSAAECDYCVIGAHTLGTDAATFNVQYWDGGAWVDLCAATSPTTDEPVMVIFLPETRQRWRVNITAGTPEMGVVKFGKALQMQRPLYSEYTPFRSARKTEFRSNRSESGESLGRTKVRSYLEFPLSWSSITRDWFDANWLQAILAIEGEAFFVAPMPSFYGEVAFCEVVGSIPAPRQASNGFVNFGMNVRGRAYE